MDGSSASAVADALDRLGWLVTNVLCSIAAASLCGAVEDWRAAIAAAAMVSPLDGAGAAMRIECARRAGRTQLEARVVILNTRISVVDGVVVERSVACRLPFLGAKMTLSRLRLWQLGW
jgi:hypothetical protein